MLYRSLLPSLFCLVVLSSAEKLESGAQKYWVEEGTAIVTLKVVTSNPGLTVTTRLEILHGYCFYGSSFKMS